MRMDSSEVTYINRINGVIGSIEKRGIEAFLISNEKNIRYLTGFWGKDSKSLLLLCRGHKILFTDFRFIEQANRQKTVDVSQWWEPRIRCFVEKVTGIGLKNIAFEDCLPYFDFGKLSDSLSGIGLIPAHGVVEELRKIKDGFELDRIRTAAGIADAVFQSFLELLKPGISELDMATEMDYRIKKMGADDSAFDIVVASGMNSSMPHAALTKKRIEDFDIVMMDYGVVVDGYCSDITRTVIMGKANKKVIDIYETVKEAQELSLGSISEGISCRKLDSVARSYIEEKGYVENFGHGLGHGVGLDIHEDPVVNPSSGQMLEKGMVFTVEPGIYIPGFGGVRIEDLVALKQDGVEVLTKTDKNLIII